MKRNSDKPAPEWAAGLPGDLLDRWPRNGAGAYQTPVFLARCSGLDMADALLLSLLNAYGVPALKHYPNDGAFGKLILGQSGSGTEIYVPESMYEYACSLMESEPDMEVGSDEA